jgi:hypothetical protein
MLYGFPSDLSVGGSMGAKILLIAVLLFGSTGSVVCDALCAKNLDSEGVLFDRADEEAAPVHGACHGSGGASGSTPTDPSSTDEICFCGDLRLGPASWVVGAGDGSAAATAWSAPLEPPQARPASSSVPRPPDLLNSPFLRENPPLLS